MGKLESAIKDEITRIAKNQAKEATKKLKDEISRLKTKTSSLSSEITKLKKQRDSDKVRQRAEKIRKSAAEDPKSIRINGKWLKSLRRRLKVTQTEFGALVGASLPSVANWEANKSIPKDESKAKIAALRQMSSRDAKKLLEDAK